MTILGERFGGRMDRIAAAQSLRILIMVAIVPAAITAAGFHGSDAYAQGAKNFDASGFVLLMALTFPGQRRLPAHAHAQCIRPGLARGDDSADRDVDRPVDDAAPRVQRRSMRARVRARIAPLVTAFT